MRSLGKRPAAVQAAQASFQNRRRPLASPNHAFSPVRSSGAPRHAGRRTRLLLPIHCSSDNVTDGETEMSRRDSQPQQETQEQSVLDDQQERDGAAPAEPQSPPAASEGATSPAPPPLEMQLQNLEPEVQAAFTVRGKLLRHRVQLDLGDGRLLTVKALEEEWREETREILADAFSDAMGGFGGYRKYMSNQIGNYLKEHMNMPPLAVVLVGVLSEPMITKSEMAAAESNGTGGDIQVDEAGWAAASAESSAAVIDGLEGSSVISQEADKKDTAPQVRETLVGTLELSFNPATRSPTMTLNPPKDCSFLVNMAVAPDLRRKGYGALLLKAGESFAAIANREEIFLHVRFKDEPAFKLYSNNGYSITRQDFWGVELLGLQRRRLMRKEIL